MVRVAYAAQAVSHGAAWLKQTQIKPCACMHACTPGVASPQPLYHSHHAMQSCSLTTTERPAHHQVHLVQAYSGLRLLTKGEPVHRHAHNRGRGMSLTQPVPCQPHCGRCVQLLDVWVPLGATALGANSLSYRIITTRTLQAPLHACPTTSPHQTGRCSCARPSS